MPSPQDVPKKGKSVVRFVELDITLSAPRPVLESVAKADSRVRILDDGSAELAVRSLSPTDAVAELKQFGDGIRKSTTRAKGFN
jgi:hypothetical protein